MKRLIISVVLALMVGTPVFAQRETKKEITTFVETKGDKVSLKNCTKTKHTYKTKDGKVYPVYLSKNKKAFIVRVSKNTGREYKQYLPKVTEQINKEG